jgi:hypothetical protein
MKEMNDEELQAWLDAQFRVGSKLPEPETDDEAVRLYEQIFRELSVKPDVDLSYGFSAAVVRQIQQKEAAAKERKAYILFAVCLLLMPLVALAFQAVFRIDDLKETLHALGYIKFPALFVILLLAMIQWADRRFVKRKLNP